MEDFTPVSGLIGGLMLGAATVLLLWLNGRLAGISGIVGGIVNPKSGDAGWRVVFVVGILLGTFVSTLVAGGGLVQIQTSIPVLAVAGLLVGFGTRLGSGCTSGHGLCGLSRLSRRSVAATLVFFGVAMLTVFLVRHAF